MDISYATVKELSLGQVAKKRGTYEVEDFMDDTYGLRVGAGSLLRTDLEIALDAGYLKAFNLLRAMTPRILRRGSVQVIPHSHN